MENEDDKDSIKARLGNLKNTEEIYRKVSVRDDYTIEEVIVQTGQDIINEIWRFDKSS